MLLANILSSPSCWSQGRWELSAHPLWKFSLASLTKMSFMCVCWGNSFLPWVSSFPLSTTWREQCIAVFDFEILSTSTERPIFPPKCCPSVWSKSVATLNMFLPLLNLHCVSFEIKSTNDAGLLLICAFFCKIYFLCTYGCYSVWTCVYFHIQTYLKSLVLYRV